MWQSSSHDFQNGCLIYGSGSRQEFSVEVGTWPFRAKKVFSAVKLDLQKSDDFFIQKTLTTEKVFCVGLFCKLAWSNLSYLHFRCSCYKLQHSLKLYFETHMCCVSSAPYQLAPLGLGPSTIYHLSLVLYGIGASGNLWFEGRATFLFSKTGNFCSEYNQFVYKTHLFASDWNFFTCNGGSTPAPPELDKWFSTIFQWRTLFQGSKYLWTPYFFLTDKIIEFQEQQLLRMSNDVWFTFFLTFFRKINLRNHSPLRLFVP